MSSTPAAAATKARAFRHDEQTWHEADFRISNEKGGDFEFWDNYRNDRQRGSADALQPAEEPNSR